MCTLGTFVMTLKYSGKNFRKVVWKADQASWARLHEEVFRTFGGSVQCQDLTFAQVTFVYSGISASSVQASPLSGDSGVRKVHHFPIGSCVPYTRTSQIEVR
jgi:hypothetical protein